MSDDKELSKMSGPEKAAAFMLAIGDDYGKPIWEMLSEEEVRELSVAMSNLGQVSAQTVETLFSGFSGEVTGVGSLNGSFDTTERLLAKILPGDRVSTIMEEIRGPAGRTMWDKLGNVNEMVLASYLKNEYPQTVAVVLNKIKPEHAARVLSVLPEDFSMEVVMRMLRMEAVQKDIIDKVEQTLRIEFMNNLARTSRRDSHETIAEIFNFLDRNSETRFLTALEDRNRESAERIRALMFTFEDLAKLDPGGVQTLLRNVDKGKLALALKGASDTLRDLFFSNMSERAAKILREDMEAMGPVRLRDVDEAQMTMVNKAKDLAEEGEIMLTDSKGEDELIY
ncbi:flagellar motor switch protein FliG [Iodidimonas gelatinilytica]|uniref:Flagellar motor switch protein FliG n=2 Tax=Iodidimonas TaxID=2066486 RepID=A0A5A7MXH1_9PROT|nr:MULTISPECIES: flagellar motor switch protein FliG [Iodidimonas]GEQ98189.1 flagellar motor switch protein FliG [Iodidimonas gelatinilytica]GER00652.1 flagellar motor switch protein FliG [Iodidimonas gelatinilytica]GER07799.1 flagellar motor switch protein FliG [Kordiimonadales bacterium JCM 17843]GGO15172.1 flagellar motor switch protein FliG [Iodidimonas muriae]